MNTNIQRTNCPLFRIPLIAFALIILFQAQGLLASEPPANVRIEDGILRWDAADGAISYNVYATTGLVNRTGYYVETVVDDLEFELSASAFYTVVAYYGGTPEVFSAFSAGEFVRFGDEPVLSNSELRELFFTPIVTSPSEIRTNRCTNVSDGSGCVAMCSTSGSWIATGGACRADAAIELHQRAISGGYECLATASTAWVETDVICISRDNF